jgi:hypothetical protein
MVKDAVLPRGDAATRSIKEVIYLPPLVRSS